MTDDAGNYRIVSPKLTVKAMRDSGYKSTAYALAELIDNSIDATATMIEVFACESPVQLTSQVRHRIDTIAVLDNGTGMDPIMLRRALKFGDSGGDSRRKRIGRFGMGLPNSSMSQCTKVEVWSWTDGPGNAMYTYLDLDEIDQGCDDVPEPQRDPVPEFWRKLSRALSDTGTLVVWSNLDRVQWYGAAATLRNTEELIGRVYRHYINDGRADIRLVPVCNGEAIDGEQYARVNDPLYLMTPSSTPAPFADALMFEPFDTGNPDEPGVVPFPIKHNGHTHIVKVKAAIARPEARRHDVPDHPWPANANPNQDPGNHPWGKHAKRNIGISLVREGRELDLDTAWAIGYDPIERWWGVEIDFPAALDAVFGVTNNKQNATIFSSLAHFDWAAEAETDETVKAFKERLAELNDPRLPIIDLAMYLEKKLLGPMRRRLRQQRVGSRKGKKRHGEGAAAKASDTVKRRREEGHTGKTDQLDEQTSPQDKRKEQIQTLTERHQVDSGTAESLVDEALAQDMRTRWISNYQDTPAFFSIDFDPGMLQVVFNTKHPLHDKLVALLDDVPEDSTADDLRYRLDQAASTFQLLLFSWARMEDEIPTNDKRRARIIEEARQDWGRYARDFIRSEDDE